MSDNNDDGSECDQTDSNSDSEYLYPEEELEAKLTEIFEGFDLHCFLKAEKKSTPHLIQTVIDYLENKKEYETHLFYNTPQFGNLLGFLHFIEDTNVSKSEEINDQIRNKRFKTSLNAIHLHIRLLLRSFKFKEAYEEFLYLNKSKLSKLELTVAKTEYAYCVCKFPTAGQHRKAIEIYKEALKIPDMGTEYRALWTYQLMQTYNYLLKPGSVVYQDKENLIEPIECFHQIGAYLESLCKLNNCDTYKARAYIDYHSAYQRIHTHVQYNETNQIEESIPQCLKNVEWPREAIKLAPDDCHVLGFIGQFMEHSATDVDSLMEATLFFKKCLVVNERSPGPYAQLGKTYMKIWFEVNGFQEAYIHNNTIRTGDTKKMYGNKNNKKRKGKNIYVKTVLNKGLRAPYKHETEMEPDEGYEHAAADVKENTSAKINPAPVETITIPRMQSKLKIPEELLQLERPSVKELPEVPKINQATIVTPNKTKGINQKKKQWNQPDYFDKLKSSNPQRGDLYWHEKNDNYLIAAIKCLCIANNLTRANNCKYLVDLARMYISKIEYEKAGECFKIACNCNGASPYDLAYAHEQYGLFLQGKKDGDIEDIDYDNIIIQYRYSIWNSIKARVKSRMAFYKLKEILEIQLEIQYPGKESKNRKRKYETELTLLHIWVNNFKRAKGLLSEVDVTESLNEHWELVYAFYEDEDYDSAFVYLDILLKHLTGEKLKKYRKPWSHKHSPFNRQGANDVTVCIDIMFKAANRALEEKQDIERSKNILLSCFKSLRILCGDKKISKSSLPEGAGQRTPTHELTAYSENKKAYDIILLSVHDSEKSANLEKILRMFSGLEIFSKSDIEYGTNVCEEYEEASCKSNTMLLLCEKDEDTEKPLCENFTFKGLLDRHKGPVVHISPDQHYKQSIHFKDSLDPENGKQSLEQIKIIFEAIKDFLSE